MFYLLSVAPGRLRVLAHAALLGCAHLAGQYASPAQALEFGQVTRLTIVDHRTLLYAKIEAMKDGRYELAGGEPVDFERWYKQFWIDTSFEFITDLNQGLSVIWGFSTGERGEKYVIEPSFKIGFSTQYTINAQSALQFSAAWLIGGRLREKPCTADYGEIGGVQSVNCRLAAAPVEPAETLKYLLKESPVDRLAIGVRYQLVF